MHSASQSNYREKLVCRTCLKMIHGASFNIYDTKGEDGTSIAQVLKIIAPELYLGLSASPEICNECIESVRIAYSFRKQCLQTENTIGSYMKAARCNASIIDLYNVLEYNGNTERRACHDVQKIISDWEDDSSEDNSSDLTNKPATKVSNRLDVPLDVKECFVPTCHNTDANSSKIFISVPHQDDICRKWCSAAGIKKVSTIKSSNLYCCEDHFNLQEDCENWVEYRMRNIKMRMKEDARPHRNLKGECTSTFQKYRSQLSPNSRKRRMENIEFDNMNTSNFVKEVPSISADGIPQKIIISPKKFTKVHLPSNPTPVGNIKNQPKPNTKILFRNNNEELCIIGSRKWTEKTNELKMENRVIESKKKAEPVKQTELIKETNPLKQKEKEPINILREPQLNVCEETGLYKNKYGEYFNAALEAMNDNEVNAEKIKARIRSENLSEINETCSLSENFICEETGLFKNSKGEYFTECGKLLDIQEVEAEKVKAKIRGENLFQITNICTVPEEAMDKVEEVPDKTISSLEISTSPPSPLENLQKLVYSTESNNCGDKILNNHDVREELIDIKEEPLQMNVEEGQLVFNYVPEHNKETLTASESVSYQNLEGLLESLDTCETSQYVDVPEFVQINHFTMNDLENLKKQQQSLHGETQQDLISLQNTFTSLPYGEQIIETDINLKMLLAGHSSLNSQVSLNQNMPEKVDFGEDLFVQSKERYRLDKLSNRLSILALPELTKGNIIGNLNRPPSGKYSRKLSVPAIMKRTAQKPRRRNVKIIAVNENETKITKNSNANTSYPNREICVLFTNYSHDGLYINDHDYLMTPYKRNKILLKENGLSFCMCFICGYKHRVEEHVLHMNLHNPKCRVCNVNLGTGYMLNLHVRTHIKPCKICTDLVPYSDILKHERTHKEKELELFENDKGRKRKRKDDLNHPKPLYYSLPSEDYHISRSPILSSVSSQVPSNEVDGMQVKVANENNIESSKTDVNNTNIENVGANNVEENNAKTNNVEKENAEAINVKTNCNIIEAEVNSCVKKSSECSKIEEIKADANSFVKESSECSEMEEIKADVNSTITNITDTKNIEMNESNSAKPKKLYSKRKRSRKTENLSKEECDLEEKLLRICEKSKEHANKRVLRSSFVKQSSECSSNDRIAGNKCSYLNCGLTKRIDPALRIYRFPVKDTARCQKWIMHSGNPAFADLSPESLKNKYICSKHFMIDDLEMKTLRSGAVPFHYSTCDGSDGAESADDKEHFEDIVPEFNGFPSRTYVPVRGTTRPS